LDRAKENRRTHEVRTRKTSKERRERTGGRRDREKKLRK